MCGLESRNSTLSPWNPSSATVQAYSIIVFTAHTFRKVVKIDDESSSWSVD